MRYMIYSYWVLRKLDSTTSFHFERGASKSLFPFRIRGANMAKKKVTYKGRKFTVLEENNNRVKLTDGTIHFWVDKKYVE